MGKNNLELKHYCSNFDEVRKVLKKLGAKKEKVISQKDYFFELSKKGARMKLRVEGKNQSLIYYERPVFSKGKITPSKIDIYFVNDNKLLPFLIGSLGVKVIVEKRREIWRKENTIFNIDKVKNVGDVFEVELQKNGKITEADKKQFKIYQEALIPFLGEIIKGSNADLVSKK